MATNRQPRSFCKHHKIIRYERIAINGAPSIFCPACWAKYYASAPAEIQEAIDKRDKRINASKKRGG